MKNMKKFKDVIEQTQVIRPPKHRIATFGNTVIHYHLVSPIVSASPQCTLRIGHITTEKPKILTPEAFAQRFHGFGDEEESFESALKDYFQEAFRGLEYNFRNNLESTDTHQMEAFAKAKIIKNDLDKRDVPRSAVIFGPEKGWQFSLMKFILEETSQSFAVNVRELDERGLFDPAQAMANRERREIESLFQQARQNPAFLKPLGEKLRQCGLFEDYQDRFFSLIKH